MNKISPIKFTQVVMLFLGLAASLSAWSEDKPAQQPEAPLVLPAPAVRYLDFYSSQQLDFAIDPDSITIQPGPDAELRYTLKATSKQGAVNVSYEGIRCSSRQKIIYAIGRSDGSWSPARAPEWSAIYGAGLNIQHATLANGYFCSGESVANKLPAIIRRIEAKKPLDELGR